MIAAVSQPDYLDVSTDEGIVTATVTAEAVEEREATALLAAVQDAMSQAGPDLRGVVLDLADVGFINSSGLAALIEIRNGADARGAPTILYRIRDDVTQLFTMVKIDRLYGFASTSEELEALVPGE